MRPRRRARPPSAGRRGSARSHRAARPRQVAPGTLEVLAGWRPTSAAPHPRAHAPRCRAAARSRGRPAAARSGRPRRRRRAADRRRGLGNEEPARRRLLQHVARSHAAKAARGGAPLERAVEHRRLHRRQQQPPPPMIALAPFSAQNAPDPRPRCRRRPRSAARRKRLGTPARRAPRQPLLRSRMLARPRGRRRPVEHHLEAVAAQVSERAACCRVRDGAQHPELGRRDLQRAARAPRAARSPTAGWWRGGPSCRRSRCRDRATPRAPRAAALIASRRRQVPLLDPEERVLALARRARRRGSPRRRSVSTDGRRRRARVVPLASRSARKRLLGGSTRDEVHARRPDARRVASARAARHSRGRVARGARRRSS